MTTELGHNLGTQMVITGGVDAWITSNPYAAFFAGECLGRFSRSDWGDLDVEDRQANDTAKKLGYRLLAAYAIPDNAPAPSSGDDKLWIITEEDRSVTTVLFPSEY